MTALAPLPSLSSRDFPAFFQALHGFPPFPWQVRLLRDLATPCSGAQSPQAWPDSLALPTASGKTACIDIALFHLALQAELSPDKRAAPRRIFFCVDRRIIVDQAFERARLIVRRLREAADGPLSTVRRRLSHLAGGDAPLAVFQLRGGMYRDDAWATSPVQPTVICTTVDQLGSRLLFRGYGISPRSAPIHAGLAANDSLIFLDEAHCSEPFRQTLDAIRLFRSPRWAEQHQPTPFAFVEMSATPRGDGNRFDLNDDDRADKRLGPRLSMPKPATIVETRLTWRSDGFAAALAEHALRFAEEGSVRIAVMVNRVHTALRVHALLKQRDADTAVLMIGRMRPLDRDALVARWAGMLAARPQRPEPPSPVFVVATQCLEVGADFDFDALVTECASLDALRQRSGRLNRLGSPNVKPRAAIVAPIEATVDSTDDPIYGPALHETWKWLCGHAKGKARVVDFAPDAIDDALPADGERRRQTLAALSPPAPDAPVMLPAHVDLWCQTEPAPAPDSDVALFLHGPDRGVPIVSVCWRADLPVDPERWDEVVGLIPPSSPECMPVPLHAVRAWMCGTKPEDDLGDTDHGAAPDHDLSAEPAMPDRRVLLWRPQEARHTTDPREVRPGDVVVISSSLAPTCDFGHLPEVGAALADRAEQAHLIVRRRAALRLRPDLLRAWYGDAAAPLIELVAGWQHDDPPQQDIELLRESLRAIGQSHKTGDHRLDPARARAIIAAELRALSPAGLLRALKPHPAGGFAIIHPHRVDLPSVDEPEETDFSDESQESSIGAGPITLRAHTQRVVDRARAYSAGLACHLEDAVACAASLHDLGKLDPRFQTMLAGSRLRALGSEPLAKSEVPSAQRPFDPAGGRSTLPRNFRHEFLSAQLAVLHPALRDTEPELHDLIIHLVVTHHGYGRPLAPVVTDESLCDLPGFDALPAVVAEARTSWAPAHRLDSGVCDRFWRLTRRYGWWGLAYLEAVLRLADRDVSRQEQEQPT